MIKSRINPLMKLLTRAKRAGAAAIVRGVAGLPVGSARRRGTVLILVIGALALISVITLIYATIGQGDRRQSASTKLHVGVETTANEVADYIAQAIADGTFATQNNGVYEQGRQTLPMVVRTSSDYPWTDPYMLSVRKANAPAKIKDRKFNPQGSFSSPWFDLNTRDARIPATPFLATTQPMSLKLPSPGVGPKVIDEHDWMHITNVAPDGRFVNLWNLAPTYNGTRVSSFRALSVNPVGVSAPGSDPLIPTGGQTVKWAPQPPTLDASSRVVSEMGYGLTLFDATGNPTSNLDDGTAASANVPAHWSSRQQWMFRPAAGPTFFPSPAPINPIDPAGVASANSPGSVWYLPYQYCDADGDGFFDSRWFELVDATDPDNPISFLPKDDRYRWFAAVRVVDLSSMVNVNTATDLAAPAAGGARPPAQAARFGATPADIDLARLLKMDDLYRLYAFNAANNPVGYAGLQIPQHPSQTSPDDYNGYDQGNARAIGDRAYRTLRMTLRQSTESVLPATTPLMSAPGGLVPDLWRDDRYAYYTDFGGQPEAGYARVGLTSVYAFGSSALFGAADAKELLTFFGVNNPSSTSRLEATTEGRFGQGNGGTAATAGLGPLRSNRGDAIERKGVDITDPNGNPMPLGDGLADRAAMTRSIFDVRHYITPLSCSRPLRSWIIPPATPAGLSYQYALSQDGDLKIDVIDALKLATDVTVTKQDPSKVFKGYADALLPYSWLRTQNNPVAASAWDPTSRYATLNFGHNAELALRIAGVMAANLIDSYDNNTPLPLPQTTPQNIHAFTLLINGDPNTRQRIRTGGPDADKFPWWNEPGTARALPLLSTYPGRLDLEPEQELTPVPAGAVRRLAHAASVTPPDPQTAAKLGAVNIYGLEAQPFITAVSSFFVYWDAPTAFGGTDESQGGAVDDPITIDGAVGGHDDLGQIIAFQLTNPFDVDIGLTRAVDDPTPLTNANEYSDFYLQFDGDMANGGNLYKLAEIDDANPGQLKPIVLHKGETRVFYCLSEGFNAMQRKWMQRAPTAPAALKNFVNNQLGISPSGAVPGWYTASEILSDGRIAPIQIQQMSQVGVNQVPTGHNFVNGTSAEAHKHVLLWRTLHSQQDLAGNPNKRFNDMLVDHLRDPGIVGQRSATLDRRLPAGDHPVIGSHSGREDDPAFDNTGFSIVMWGMIRRHRDPGVAGSTPPLGAIPAYCVEAKWNGAGTNLSNVPEVASADPGALKRDDFRLGPPLNAAIRLSKMFQLTGAIPASPPATRQGVIIKTMTEQPKDWSSTVSPMPSNQDVPAKTFDKLYPVAHLNNKKFEAQTATTPPVTISTMRLADLLLPMGLGTINDPDPTLSNPQDPGANWMTLSEALGLALNYSNPPAPAANQPPTGWSIYYKVGDSKVGVIDRGNLALDRGAPFEHVGGGQLVYQPATDLVRFPGIPLSLNVLNTFTVTEPQFGGLTHGTPGLVNINTAPPAVLNLIPFWCPTTEPGVWDNVKLASGWVAGASTVPGPSTTGTDGTDLATTSRAYRDKLFLVDRDQQPVHFEDTPSVSPFENLKRDGRTLTNQVPTAIGPQREGPGFGTTGEFLAMVDRTAGAGLARIRAVGDRADGLAQDNRPSGMPGMNTTLFRLPSETMASAPTPAHIDTVPDDYAEKLAIAQASLGSVTVRSDMFAVWFVLQGYQKSDTENLGLNDPLKPSVSKRYLMIVDRSGVTRKGEKPRIVFLTEVPM